MGRLKIPRSASSGVGEGVEDLDWTGLVFLEDLHGRISRHLVWAEARQSAALGVKGRGAESVLAGQTSQTWRISWVLVAAAALLPFAERAVGALPTVNAEVQPAEAEAVLADQPLTR